MTEPTLIIAGCGGAMGRAVIKSALAARMKIAGGFDRAQSDVIGRDIGVIAGGEPIGVQAMSLSNIELAAHHIIIDFTTSAASLEIAAMADKVGAPHIIGSTGFNEKENKKISQYAERITIVKSGNMSLGVNLLSALVEQGAKVLGEEYDIEVVEAHHRRKVDAPSGTALMLAEAAATGRNISLKEKAVLNREGVSEPRKTGDVGFAVIRGGGIIGDHDVHFAGDKELLTLSHHALDRGLFAEGALAAAKWINAQPPGLYTMRDVLGL